MDRMLALQALAIGFAGFSMMRQQRDSNQWVGWVMQRARKLASKPRVRHHAVITGTGRSGTTFLMHMLTELRQDTGFADPLAAIHDHCHAGLESDLASEHAPYFVKQPWLCTQLGDIMARGGVVVDHCIVPVRDLYSAAQSRRHVLEKEGGEPVADLLPGALMGTDKPEEQEAVLAIMQHKLFDTLARYEIPVTLLHYPRLVLDPDYLYRNLKPVLSRVSWSRFADAYRKVCRPEWVHHFEEPSMAVK